MNSLNCDDFFQQHSDCNDPGCSFVENLEHLRKAPMFSGTSLEILKLFAYFFKTRYYKKNDLILEQGKQADSAFFLIKGEVESYHNVDNNEKDPFFIKKMEPLSFFGEMALLARFKYFFNVIACTDTKVLALDKKSFQKMTAKYPDRHNDLVEWLVQIRLKRFENQMSSFIQRLRDEHGNK